MNVIPEPPGPPTKCVTNTGSRRRVGVKLVTWVEKDGTQLLHSRGVLDHSEARISCGVVAIVHRNLEIPALVVRIRRNNPKVITTPPRNLGDI